MERSNYRHIRWQRACRDAGQALSGNIKFGIVCSVTAMAVGAAAGTIFQLFTGKPADMSAVLFAFLSGLFSTVLAGLLYLAFYYFAAPSRMYREDQEQIAGLKEALEQKAAALRVDFDQSFRSYADARAELWAILDSASARQKQIEIDYGGVREWVKKVKFPVDILSILQGESLYDYAKTAIEKWGDDRKEFLGFCLMLYREDSAPILSDRERKSLDNHRKDLSKFWNDWERRWNGQGTSVCNTVKADLIQSQTPDVMMLTYLEIAYGFHQKENSRGKQELFKVARDFRQSSNLL